MNEQIRNIAVAADVWCDQYCLGHDSYDTEWEQKFAQLIVLEAIGVCRVDVDALTAPFLSEYEKGVVEGYRRANENLRGYFGVEE